MADYIYLLENRLSTAQKNALTAVREVLKAKGLTLFLVGGAVRDLTSGSPVRDLDVAVQGNALKLKKDLELAGAVVTGSVDATQSLFLRFPGGVRMEIGSTLSVTYPKPGKPVYTPATILEDLRRRDFTANAMALSLNDGSYGLLMDPLNGVADIENRELRLVSNYGFIEEPVRMIRAVRFSARLGWTLEEKTQTRYETGKSEGYISAIQDAQKGYEAEEIAHEEDPLRVMRRLESEGWMQVIAPAWSSSKANVAELDKVREVQTQLQMQGIHPDPATVNFPLLTAKLNAKEVADLKKSFPRPGFVEEIDALEAEAKAFATELGGKAAAKPSAAYKLISSAKPEAVLSVAYGSKSAALQAKFKSFFGEWPAVKNAIPYALMQEMRITPELPVYTELVEKLFFELMDGNLGTTEELKAFLEPYSPPAPPPPVHLRRPRATRKDAKGAKAKAKREAEAADDDDDDDDDDPSDPSDEDEAEAEDEDLNEVAELSLGGRRRRDEMDLDEDDGGDEDEKPAKKSAPSEEEPEDEPVAKSKPAPRASTSAPAPVAKVAPAPPPAAVKVAAKVVAKAPAKVAAKVVAVAKAAPVKAKAAPVKVVAKKAVPAKTVKKSSAPTPVKAKVVAKAAPVKAVAKKAVPAKAVKKVAVPVKVAAKKAVAKKAVPVKAVAKKVAAKAPVKGKAPVKVAKKGR
ncbi:Poly A polymerase head domain-containing protein [Granulicella pectinivorans]|uniref:Poly A polymerase head domain-containing protein n=1 Tax=Granulicella pectinivorans TaxID=474950 RepID=A0A1I6MND1_9BACT|nr:CCA tRNA nucleotidyltransferase [Granulicella pectinivorans]SFS17190.1 Poly A polymerase head domain-containing protein [Granulicella pectinivorans]